MTPFRKFIYHTVGIFAALTLIQIPFAFGASSVLSDSDNVNSALKDSGAYPQFVPLVIKNITEKQENIQAKQILEDEGVKQAITSSITEADVETSAQSIITGVYGWLEGRTKLPEFTIDLTRASGELTGKLAAYAEQRASSLPTCTLQQLQTIDLQGDILSIPCLPPGVSPQQIGQQFVAQANQQIEFLQEPIITNKTLIKDQDVAQAEQDAANGPKAYQSIQNSKWVTLGFAAVLAALLILARRNRRAGLKYVAILLVGTGLLVGLVAILFSAVDPKSIDATEGEEVVKIIAKVAILIGDKIMATAQWFALGYIAAGGLILLYLNKLRPESPEPQQTSPSSPVV